MRRLLVVLAAALAVASLPALGASATAAVDATVTITSAPAQVTTLSAQVSFTTTNATGVTCRVNGAVDSSTCTSPFTATGLNDGPNTVTVEVDPGPAFETRTITVDIDNIDLAWSTTPPSPVANAAPASWSWLLTGDWAEVYCIVDRYQSGYYTEVSRPLCESTLTGLTLDDGDYRLTVFAWGVFGPTGTDIGSEQIEDAFTVDALPDAAVDPLPTVIKDGPITVPLSYGASASGSPRASYDVRYRTRSWLDPTTATAWTTPANWSAVAGSSVVLTDPAPGQFYCFSARALDAAAHLGPWSSERCTSVALDDRRFTRLENANGGTATTQWVRESGARNTFGTVTRTSAQGHAARSVAALPWGGQLALIAPRCPTCGAVRIEQLDAGQRVTLARRSLAADTRTDQVLLALPPSGLTSSTASRLRVVVTSSGKPVMLDGFAVVTPPSLR